MNLKELSLQSVVITNKNVVSCDLDGDMAILNMDDGLFYRLNPLGKRIWELIQGSQTVKFVLETLLDEYDIGEDQCKNDLLDLLQNLIKKGLIVLE